MMCLCISLFSLSICYADRPCVPFVHCYPPPSFYYNLHKALKDFHRSRNNIIIITGLRQIRNLMCMFRLLLML